MFGEALNAHLYMYVIIIRNRDCLRVDKEAGQNIFSACIP